MYFNIFVKYIVVYYHCDHVDSIEINGQCANELVKIFLHDLSSVASYLDCAISFTKYKFGCDSSIVYLFSEV